MANQRNVPLQLEVRAHHDARRLGRRRDNIRDDHASMRLKKMKIGNVSKARPGEGRLSEEIVNGTYKVLPLEDSDDTIGSMVYRCTFCGALKYLRETLSMCCMKGLLSNVPVFPRPTPEIERLIHNDSEESSVFHHLDQGIMKKMKFAQLYIHDSIDDTTLRYENLYLPLSTSNREKELIKSILENEN